MRVYVVVPTEEAYLDSSTKLYVFANKADAEEMVLALAQEELCECFILAYKMIWKPSVAFLKELFIGKMKYV